MELDRERTVVVHGRVGQEVHGLEPDVLDGQGLQQSFVIGQGTDDGGLDLGRLGEFLRQDVQDLPVNGLSVLGPFYVKFVAGLGGKPSDGISASGMNLARDERLEHQHGMLQHALGDDGPELAQNDGFSLDSGFEYGAPSFPDMFCPRGRSCTGDRVYILPISA